LILERKQIWDGNSALIAQGVKISKRTNLCLSNINFKFILVYVHENNSWEISRSFNKTYLFTFETEKGRKVFFDQLNGGGNLSSTNKFLKTLFQNLSWSYSNKAK
jgi:hypothetical protein